MFYCDGFLHYFVCKRYFVHIALMLVFTLSFSNLFWLVDYRSVSSFTLVIWVPFGTMMLYLCC